MLISEVNSDAPTIDGRTSGGAAEKISSLVLFRRASTQPTANTPRA